MYFLILMDFVLQVASGEDKSGTTAVCALITDKFLILGNYIALKEI